jgi:hypothetical protein
MAIILPNSGTTIQSGSSDAVTLARTGLEGEIKIKVYILWIVAGVVIGLILLGIGCLVWKPDFFQNYLTATLPIISGVTFGLVGFVVGKEVRKL